ncbi:alpha/beta fold hydrolase [Janibacter sp. G349]|uniref:alpha/beta fold hydrolase n=1 Tax=unclassified Janibacter TaxID=2649294 RepID=UPI0020CCBF1C|nr:alpha/beta hydrolase [Janibacter sp. CX7]UTT65819.1 alpha/beta hydrolase [Janibacter sp. CX7]
MSADPRLSTVLAPDGARIAVREHAAPAGTAEGPTLVLAHGWCLAAETWDRVVAELQARRPHLRVITYDQPGHGLSTPGHDRQVSLLDLGATLREVIAETAPEGDVVLGGHSMGGMTVMALAQVAPELFAERVRGAALVGTASWLGTRRPIPGEGIAMAVLGRLPAGTRGLPTTPRLTAANLFGTDPDPQAVRATGRLTSRTRANVVADWHRAIGELDFRDHLAPFAGVRTVVLTGARDRLTPVSAGRRLAAGIPGADFWSVPRVGHMITYEAPRLVADKIELLLDAPAASDRA